MTIPAWAGWALLSATFAALTAIFAKVGLQSVNADFATLIRTGMILAILGVFVLGTGQWQGPGTISARAWGFLTLSAIATGASWVCYFRALKLGDVSQVSAVDKFSLVLVAVFAFAFLHDRPSPRDWVGISFVAGGILMLAFKR